MAKPFTVIIPKTINDSNFVSSSLPESVVGTPAPGEPPVWQAGVNRAIGDRVVVTTGYHKIYEAIKPMTSAPERDTPPYNLPTHWVEVGPTNCWAAFDTSGGTYSYSSGANIVFSFTMDRVTSIALVELTARSVRIQATAPGYPNYYDQTYNLGDRAVISNWYDYFTADSFLSTELIITDIPAIPSTTFTITIENNGNPLQVGNFIAGTYIELGKTQYGAKIGIIDYSKKSVSEYGKVTVTQRGFSKKMDVTLDVENTVVDAVAARLNALRSTLCLWVGANGVFESLTVYGFYKDYSVEIPYPTHSLCSLQIEGIV